uniref:Nucleoprotein n=1 Tax=Bat Coronavirus RpGX17 TaxID=3018899 RepID=A0AA49EE25_9NIDO|nr:nucleocapsid phosphoprotein [Bat Coronavirus RpGX17]WCC63016.1 nucleocapsid phosphoprotein [Bat Coronavirus RpGX17]WCC63084.1 nucleocapsid phosphoprotein [Bat Coronavirus RpGX17]
MASVSFEDQSRGRTGKIPLSYFNPIISTVETPIWKLLPKNAVPTNGKAGKDQLIGYWNEQPRWRMVRGQRKTLPSKYHFYYLGTGPHRDAAFRTRLDGVYWVAQQGAKTQPTGLGNRKRNADLLVPQFSTPLPNGLEVVTESASKSNSRSQSSNRDRTPSGSRSQSRGPSENQNQNRSRNSSSSRGQNAQSQNQQVDIAAAVKQALKELGFSAEKKQSQKGNSTPRAKSPARSPSAQRKQIDRPEWKRVPTTAENVTACFGPRDTNRNFGAADVVRDGTQAKHYPQLAELVPTPAALLFGGEVTTREDGDEVEITYHYKMKVKKDDKNLPLFLSQVSAYALPSQVATTPSQLNPVAQPFTPTQDGVGDVEIINVVYDSFEA